MFFKNNNIKIKREIDWNINLCSCCIDCDFKKLEAIDKKMTLRFIKNLNNNV